MKFIVALWLALLAGVAVAQISVTGGDIKVFVSGPEIEPGSFGTQEFFITLVKGKNGQMTVGGRYSTGQARKSISGTLGKNNQLRARVNDGPQTEIDGKYNPDNDTIVITRIGNQKVDEVLERMDTLVAKPKLEIKPGTYTGQTDEPDTSWTVNITPSKSKAFNVVETATVEGRAQEVKGTLYPTGKFVGTHTGIYNFEQQTMLIDFRRADKKYVVNVRQGQAPKVSLFGLVSKDVGKIPGPGEASDHHIEGTISEDSFSVEIKMKPPYEGNAKISFGFSNNMGSTLKPGQIVELNVWGESSKDGSYKPNLAGTGQWILEGDGFQILESSKAFVGTASTGTHYPSTRGKVVFRVLGQGTIKVTACYAGQYWGPAGAWNWNPCTYIYKFREPAKAEVGGGK